MKNSFFQILIILFLISGCNLVNNPEENSKNSDVEYLQFNNEGIFVELGPIFKNGDLNAFIEKNINYSLVEKYKIPKGNYDVSIGVLINNQGFVDQVIKLSNWGNNNFKGVLEDELIRIIKKSPQWRPYELCGAKLPKFIELKYEFKINRNLSLHGNSNIEKYSNDHQIVEISPKFKNGDITTFIKDNVNKEILNEPYIPKGVYKASICVMLSKDGDIQNIINLTDWGIYGKRGILENEMSRIIKLSAKWEPRVYCGYKIPSQIKIDYDFIKE
jgi:hypothetical protein